jgi:hypothetical protein
MTNYIPDMNKFKLSGPPQWWLRRLWDFDASLVVLPSRQGFYYRLAQRRPPNLPTAVVEDIMKEEGDTRMMSSYHLVPITTILATANWSNPLMWQDLAERAPWRQGGADKMIRTIEDRENMRELDKRQETQEHLSYLGKDAWNLYNKKIGLRTRMYSPATKSVASKPTRQSAAIRPKGIITLT